MEGRDDVSRELIQHLVGGDHWMSNELRRAAADVLLKPLDQYLGVEGKVPDVAGLIRAMRMLHALGGARAASGGNAQRQCPEMDTQR